MKAVIIGSGNVATILGRKIIASGHEVLQVMSQKESNAKILADELNCSYASMSDEINKDAHLYIAAISDNGLQVLKDELYLGNKLIVHTAGSVSKNILEGISKNYGVLWPLQSLRREMKHMPEIPLLVDGNTKDNLAFIYDFAKTISDDVQVANDEKRLKLHAAAVFVNNFTNHLYAIAENYCIKEDIDFNLLLPIIDETASRLHFAKAKDMQTGPAIRNDETTIKKHLAVLNAYPDMKKIYELFTEGIIRFHNR